jgi:two-component system, sensor histidine kinase RpfC
LARCSSAGQLADALARSGVDLPDAVFVDLDTVAGAALGNTFAVIGEGARRVPVVLLSGDASTLAAAPAAADISFALLSPASDEDMRALRLAVRQLEQNEPSAPAPALPALDILVAEDNRTNQAVTKRLLERGGHHVTIVENGEQAVEAMERHGFDLVLMDINMPVMNGFEAVKLHRFASLGRRRTFIQALTADITPETVARCHEAGMDGCLHKPIDEAELNTVLAQAAGQTGRSASTSATPAPVAAEVAFDPEAVPLLDKAAFDNLAELGGPTFVEDLIATFGADGLRQIEGLVEAVEAADAPVFRDILHSLRSSSANVGARRLFALCLDWRAVETPQVEAGGEAFAGMLRSVLADTVAEMAAALAASRKAA